MEASLTFLEGHFALASLQKDPAPPGARMMNVDLAGVLPDAVLRGSALRDR